MFKFLTKTLPIHVVGFDLRFHWVFVYKTVKLTFSADILQMTFLSDMRLFFQIQKNL